MDEDSRELDLDDGSLAENSRGAYPLTAIPNASLTGKCGLPNNIIMPQQMLLVSYLQLRA